MRAIAVQAAQLIATVEVANADEGVAALQAVGTAADEAQAQLTALGTGAGEGLAASIGSADEALAGLSEEASAAGEAVAAIGADSTGLSEIASSASEAGSALAGIGADSAGLSEVATAAGEAGQAIADSASSSSGLESAISALSDSVSSLASQMSNLTGAASEAAGAMSEMGASTKEAEDSGGGLGGMLSGLGSNLSDLGMNAMVAYGNFMMIKNVIESVGNATVGAAGNFQEGMTTLVTGAGEAESNINMVGQGILQMATQTGESTDELTKGMYMIESAGQHGAAGLNVLQVAAEGAQVGNSDLETVANALTTVLTDYHMKASQASEAMNALTETVASGKTHLQDLASSMGSILPLASSLGVQFPQVAAAIATMTNHGMDAQKASMELANAMRSLAAPNSTAQKSMESVGITAQKLKDTLSHQGLEATIQMVSEAIGKKFPAGSVQAVEAFKAIMGGATGYNVALMLTGKNSKEFEKDIQNITKSMDPANKGVTGWSKVQGDFNTQMNRAHEVLQTVGIEIGEKIMPVIGKVATGFVNWEDKTHGLENTLSAVGGVLSRIGGFIGGVATGVEHVVSWFQKNQVAAAALLIPLGAISAVLVNMAATALVAFIASIPALVGGFIAWAGAAAAAAIATIAATWPILAIGAVIGLVIAGIILAVKNWGSISKWLEGVLHVVTSHVGAFFSGMGSDVHGIINKIGGWFSWLGTQAHDKVNQIIGFFGNFISFMKGLPGQALKWGEDLIQNLISGIKNMLGNLGSVVQNVAGTIAKFLHFSKPDEGPLKDADKWMEDMGTMLQQSLKAQAPKLATASLSLAQSVSLLAPKPGTTGLSSPSITVQLPANAQNGQPIILQLDGRTLAKAILPYTTAAVRNATGVRF